MDLVGERLRRAWQRAQISISWSLARGGAPALPVTGSMVQATPTRWFSRTVRPRSGGLRRLAAGLALGPVAMGGTRAVAGLAGDIDLRPGGVIGPWPGRSPCAGRWSGSPRTCSSSSGWARSSAARRWPGPGLRDGGGTNAGRPRPWAGCPRRCPGPGSARRGRRSGTAGGDRRRRCRRWDSPGASVGAIGATMKRPSLREKRVLRPEFAKVWSLKSPRTLVSVACCMARWWWEPFQRAPCSAWQAMQRSRPI